MVLSVATPNPHLPVLFFCPPRLPSTSLGCPERAAGVTPGLVWIITAQPCSLGQSGYRAVVVKLFRKLPEGAHRFQGGACVRHMESVTTGPHLAPVSHLGTCS